MSPQKPEEHGTMGSLLLFIPPATSVPAQCVGCNLQQRVFLSKFAAQAFLTDPGPWSLAGLLHRLWALKSCCQPWGISPRLRLIAVPRNFPLGPFRSFPWRGLDTVNDSSQSDTLVQGISLSAVDSRWARSLIF